jgi:hypothetical protein
MVFMAVIEKKDIWQEREKGRKSKTFQGGTHESIIDFTSSSY